MEEVKAIVNQYLEGMITAEEAMAKIVMLLEAL